MEDVQQIAGVSSGRCNTYALVRRSNESTLYSVKEDVPEEIFRSGKELIMGEPVAGTSTLFMVQKDTPHSVSVLSRRLPNDIQIVINFTTQVVSMKVNQSRIIVTEVDKIHIYELLKNRKVKKLHSIEEVPSGCTKQLDLCRNKTSLIAYPTSTVTGKVQIYDTAIMDSVAEFKAHDNPIACLKFNYDGTKLATVSTKGTIIRVFSIDLNSESVTKIHEFRQGLMPTTVSSLSFSVCSSLLSLSSNSYANLNTVQIFKLQSKEEIAEEEASRAAASWYCYIRNATVGVPLPTAFYTATLPKEASNCVAALPHIGRETKLVAVCDNGMVYRYGIPTERGECVLENESRIAAR